MTQGDLFGPDLFDKTTTKRSERVPTKNPTTTTLQTWQRLHEAHTGRKIEMPSQAAWGEIKRQCSRLATMLPDDEIREAFLSQYLHSADRYERERGYPLRLALKNERFQRLASQAQRLVAERRRVLTPTPRTPTRVTIPPTVPTPLSTPQWRAELLNVAGAVSAVKKIVALTSDAAEQMGRAWLLQEAGRNRDLVNVRVSRG